MLHLAFTSLHITFYSIKLMFLWVLVTSKRSARKHTQERNHKYCANSTNSTTAPPCSDYFINWFHQSIRMCISFTKRNLLCYTADIDEVPNWLLKKVKCWIKKSQLFMQRVGAARVINNSKNRGIDHFEIEMGFEIWDYSKLYYGRVWVRGMFL